MQTRELIRANIRVANTTDVSGRTTAGKINRSLRTGKERSFWRTARLTFLGFLTVAGLFVDVAPLPAAADDAEDSRHGCKDNDKEIRAEITDLKAQVTDLRNQVNSLQTSNTALHKQLAVVQSNHALALGPFVRVDPNAEIGVKGPNIIFSGVNIHIVSGSGSTNDNYTPRGLGNLIIGYNEDPETFADTSPFQDLPLSPLIAGDRGGSHNLVIGAAHRFTQSAFGGLVVGTANTIKGPGASVSGGAGNTADNYGGSVSGGFFNDAGSYFSSVTGGRYNQASLFFTSVSGGDSNTAGDGHYGVAASVSGGQGNVAGGDYASISGGQANDAFDDFTSITGGISNTAGSEITFQGGLGASVTGGTGNHAGGRNTVVIGGQNIIDNNDNSIAPKAPYP